MITHNQLHLQYTGKYNNFIVTQLQKLFRNSIAIIIKNNFCLIVRVIFNQLLKTSIIGDYKTSVFVDIFLIMI